MGPKAYDTEVRKSSALVEAQIGGYSLVMTNIAIENWSFIFDLPMKKYICISIVTIVYKRDPAGSSIYS